MGEAPGSSDRAGRHGVAGGSGGDALAGRGHDRLVGEAKFLRGLGYFRLMTLFGPNAPLITTSLTATDRPASADSATMWAQIEKDFTEAAAALPRQTMAQSAGRATAGAAQGMLGKTLLQERKWAQAQAALSPIIAGQYGSRSAAGAVVNPSAQTLRELRQSIAGQYGSRSAPDATVNPNAQVRRELRESVAGQYGPAR